MGRVTLRPLDSFLGVDLKLGASIISLLGLLNKIAGVYGILAVFTGGSVAQVSMYVYSIATLVLFLWGLRGIAGEVASTSFLYAHLYALDHFISTAYTVLFAVDWWVFEPHDGQRIANSAAQQNIIDEARKAGVGSGLNADEAKLAAQAKWSEEKGFSLFVLIASWLVKVFFLVCLYSFAMHLRRGTYRQLPASKPAVAATQVNPAQSAPFRRGSRSGSSPYAYSHLRTTSGATTTDGEGFEMNESEAEEGAHQQHQLQYQQQHNKPQSRVPLGLQDVLPPRTPESASLPRMDIVPPSPQDMPSAGTPTFALPKLESGPMMMRSRSAGSEVER